MRMKLINYNYGTAMYPVDTDTHYRGKILMTYDEWKEAYKYLRSYKVQKSFLPSYPWTNTRLVEDAEDPKRQRSIKGNAYRIAIRVPMTEKLVQKYGLKGYKRNNYFIEVTP